jgi:cobalt-zinc-cadmium efflux system membrane fusion protein
MPILSSGTFLRSKAVKTAGGILLAIALVVALGAVSGAVRLPWTAAAAEENATGDGNRANELAVELAKDHPHTLFVPEDVRQVLGIRKDNVDQVAVAKRPTRMRPLTMPGSTALDPTRIFRVRARFAPSPSSAEVTQIGQIAQDPRRSGSLHTTYREMHSGDRVAKGDLLAVFYSVDVGNKKNDLIDAMYQLKLDEEILKAAKAKSEVIPAVFLWNAERNVQGDINTVNRAVAMLQTWGISPEDIQAVRDEAENVAKRHGKHDSKVDELWPRVEMRAPANGVIIERNLALHEIIVDNTTNLFQVADVEKLFITANVPEDDLPELEALREASGDAIRWTVRTVGSDPIPGYIDDIGYIIDPNQHTAVVKGYIDNKGERLRGGQFVHATVDVPPPPDVVELPVSAVVDDGQQSVIFVQTDAAKQLYKMRRVQLTRRFEKTVFVRSKPFKKGEERTAEEAESGMLPKEPLLPGEKVIQTGVGELKLALQDRESAVQTNPSKGDKK